MPRTAKVVGEVSVNPEAFNILHAKIEIDNFEKILGRKGSILDIGCGPGFFINRASSKGWEVAGIEPSIDAVNYANNSLGLDTQCKRIEDIYEIDKKLLKARNVNVVSTVGEDKQDNYFFSEGFFDFAKNTFVSKETKSRYKFTIKPSYKRS